MSVRTEGWRSIDVVNAVALLRLALVIMDQTYTLRGSGLRSMWRLAQLTVGCFDYLPWLTCYGFCVGERLKRTGFDD